MFSQASLDHLHSQVALRNSMHLEVNQQLLLRIHSIHLDQQCHSQLNKPSQGLRHLVPHLSSSHNLLPSHKHRPISLMLLGPHQHPQEDLMPLALHHHQVSFLLNLQVRVVCFKHVCFASLPTQVGI